MQKRNKRVFPCCREAARECRRKKKEYIKCLENRVAVLENQNKALIDELKSLKELYCQTKTEQSLAHFEETAFNKLPSVFLNQGQGLTFLRV